MNGLRFSFALLFATAPALAAEPAHGPGHSHDDPPETSSEQPSLIPAATDTLGGHLLIGVGPSVTLPFGELDSDADFRDFAATGLGISADAGIGLGRNLVLGGWFQYSDFTEPSGCQECKATSLAFGPFIRYHLVQGVRFDPWISLGVGYRMLETEDALGKTDYSGIDWLKVAVGGDFYALSQFGFGPYMELGLGSFTDPPRNRETSAYATFSVGLRLALDLPGR